MRADDPQKHRVHQVVINDVETRFSSANGKELYLWDTLEAIADMLLANGVKGPVGRATAIKYVLGRYLPDLWDDYEPYYRALLVKQATTEELLRRADDAVRSAEAN